MATEKNIYLHGVALANYRGIGGTPQFIAPFSQFNFFIGPNNAGKSCVLSFISQHLKPFVIDHIHQSSPITMGQLDTHIGATQPTKMGIGVSRNALEKAIEYASPSILSDFNVTPLLKELLDEISDGETIWLTRSNDRRQLLLFSEPPNLETFINFYNANCWRNLWHRLTGQGGGDMRMHWIPESISRILNCAPITTPNISLIPSIRQVSEKGIDFNSWDGRGLIDELARHQNPGFQERDKLQKFERINNFLRSVTEKSDATIEIPHDREHIMVHMDKKVLPLSSLGTGIHEVVMLAAFCTLMEEQIVCIEEPEIHLHPLLQRRLIQFLEENTNNQYFIATHSARIIDTTGASIFHVTNKDGKTSVQTALTSATKFEICRDLGYRASDLLQANAIVWVEGPSDRIYLQHWISSIAPELREGIDYAIMFYGGRLLSHLSASDTEVCESDIQALIALRQLNRNLAIVIDSDKADSGAEVNSTKQRILSECNEHGGFAWITAGREIENYVDSALMANALRQTYGKFSKQTKTGPFDHVMHFKTTDGGIVKDVDKIRIAQAVRQQSAALDVLDLREKINALVELIRSANKK